jgi:hypothetical protein
MKRIVMATDGSEAARAGVYAGPDLAEDEGAAAVSSMSLRSCARGIGPKPQ